MYWAIVGVLLIVVGLVCFGAGVVVGAGLENKDDDKCSGSGSWPESL